MPTRSYRRFVKNIETVTRLKETYYETCSHRGTRGRAAYDHITRSAIIFLASAFEVYVEDVIKECCDQHIIFSQNAVNLPNTVKNTINEYVKVPGNAAPPTDLCDEGWRKVYRKIAEQKTDRLNTPKKKQIIDLFESLVDIKESDINKIKRINDLDGLIRFRGDIAHRVKADTYVKIDQVSENEDIISNVIQGIDNVIIKYFKKKYPQKRLPWYEVK